MTEEFWKNLSEILKSIPENPIPVSLVALAILAALAYVMFKKDQSGYKLAVFLSVFFGFLTLLFLILLSNRSLITSSQLNIPDDVKYSYFHSFTNMVNNDQCMNLSEEALKKVGYPTLRKGASTMIGAGNPQDNLGVASTINCVTVADRQMMYGLTFGFDGQIVSSNNDKVYDIISRRSDPEFNSRVKPGSEIDFISRSTEAFAAVSIEDCLKLTADSMKLIGLTDVSRGGELLWSPIRFGKIIASCPELTIDGPDGQSLSYFVVSLQAFGFDYRENNSTIERVIKALDMRM